MLTKGQIIKLIDNVCTVRVPYFETVASTGPVIVEAQIVIQPGQFNCYKKDDVVWLAFENNKADLPVVIGKVYSSAIDESENYPGIVQTATLRVKDAAVLPPETLLSGVSAEDLVQRVTALETALSTLKNYLNIE